MINTRKKMLNFFGFLYEKNVYFLIQFTENEGIFQNQTINYRIYIFIVMLSKKNRSP